MEYAVAAVLALYCLLVVQAEEPVSSSQVGDHSRYHQQVEFISNYLLHTSNITFSFANTTSTNQTNDASPIRQQSVKDNNTTPNEIQLIPVPAAVSSAIDTLPVHPRIPRRSSARRRSRNEHRHSTRVFQGQPVRFLLPPLENEIFQASRYTTTSLPITNATSISTERLITETTSTTTESTDYKDELSDNKLELKEFKQTSSSGPQHRRVFIPPPLRYLLPPFFYENYINAQSTSLPTAMPQETTTEAFTLLTEKYYYSTNSSELGRNKSIESSSLAPIIVLETETESDYELENWNYPIQWEEYITSSPIDHSHKESVKEVETKSSIDPFSANNFSSGTISQQQYSKIFFENPLEIDYDEAIETHQSDSSSPSPSTKSLFSTTTPITPTSEPFTFAYGRYKTTPKANYKQQQQSRSTTSIPSTTSTTSSYPFLTGPNIEQVLFETGDFMSINISNNDSSDPTLTMMDRPLLAQDVAQAGMKITAHIKKEQINRESLRRGKSKFRHLNQFNFESDINSRESSKSSQLDVAESSYYNGRRASKQVVQEPDIRAIPGRAGQDYPTYTKPPRTNFSCRSVSYHRGYVADPSTGCQVFYICVGDGPGEPMLCPNGTIFSQDFLVCDWWYNVDCQ